MHPVGLEPTTFSLRNMRSIRLSYGCTDRILTCFIYSRRLTKLKKVFPDRALILRHLRIDLI